MSRLHNRLSLLEKTLGQDSGGFVQWWKDMAPHSGPEYWARLQAGIGPYLRRGLSPDEYTQTAKEARRQAEEVLAIFKEE